MPTAPAVSSEINPKLPIAAQVYAVLKHMILSLAFQPNEALSEKELSLRLGVSRTPVREALIRLAEEALVYVLPQRGTFVAPIHVAEVMEAQFIREALEAAVVRRAAEQPSPSLIQELTQSIERQQRAAESGEPEEFMALDEGFHRAISDAIAMPRAWKVIQSVKGQMDRVRYLSLPDKTHMIMLTRQHADIVDAIRTFDPDLAEERTRHHLQEVFKTVRILLRENPKIFV